MNKLIILLSLIVLIGCASNVVRTEQDLRDCFDRGGDVDFTINKVTGFRSAQCINVPTEGGE